MPVDDVHVGHDLQPRGDRGPDLRGQRPHVPQCAVDAEAHPQPVGLWLDVDVLGAVAQALGDDQVDDLHNRGVGAERCEVGDRAVATLPRGRAFGRFADRANTV